MSRRTERLGSMLQRELAMVIMRELNDPRLVGLPSITRVKVSDDCSIADVYVSVMGTEGKQTAALNALKHSAGLMRTRLTKVMEIRQVPFLKFHLDEGLKKEMAILETLRKIELERQQTEAEKAAGASPDQSQPESSAEPSAGADDSASVENDR